MFTRRAQLLSLTIVIVVTLIVVWITLTHHQANRPNLKDQQRAPSVVIAIAQTQDVPVYLSALGTATPANTITIRTQVNGRLLRVLFNEGQIVNAHDLLAEIDPRPFEAQLLQYQGQLTRDLALLANAKLDLQRYQTLWHQDSVAKQTLDTQAALVKQYEGTVKIDEGLIANTKLNLSYAHITAPVAGRIGLQLVDPGNIVQTTDANGIAVLTTVNPIMVVFTLPEDVLPQVLLPLNAQQTLRVNIYDRAQNKLLATCHLVTVDNQIDPTTGTIKLKAECPNRDNALFPNQFVNVRLRVKILSNVVVVPTAAIQHSAQNSFVYLLLPNHTVRAQTVVTSVTSGKNTVITSGVLPAQAVVVEGADRLTDGLKVTVANASLLSSRGKDRGTQSYDKMATSS